MLTSRGAEAGAGAACGATGRVSAPFTPLRLLLLLLCAPWCTATAPPVAFNISVAATHQLISFNVVPPGGMSVASVLSHLDPLDSGTYRDPVRV